MCQDRSEFQTTAVPALSPRFCQIVRTCHDQTRSTTTTYYDHLQLSTAAYHLSKSSLLGESFTFNAVTFLPSRRGSQSRAMRADQDMWTEADLIRKTWHGWFCPECRLVLQLPCILQRTTSFPASEMLRLTLLNKPFKANWMRMSPQGKALPNAKRPSLFPKNIYVLWWVWMHAECACVKSMGQQCGVILRSCTIKLPMKRDSVRFHL